MIGTKLYKNKTEDEDMERYTDVAVWCNGNTATIEDKGDYYEVVEVKQYEPTTEEKVAQLDTQYEQDKKTLQGYYMDFFIAGDTDGMEQIKGELIALATQYDTDIETLKGGEE